MTRASALSLLGLDRSDIEFFIFNFRARIKRNNNALLHSFRGR